MPHVSQTSLVHSIDDYVPGETTSGVYSVVCRSLSYQSGEHLEPNEALTDTDENVDRAIVKKDDSAAVQSDDRAAFVDVPCTLARIAWTSPSPCQRLPRC